MNILISLLGCVRNDRVVGGLVEAISEDDHLQKAPA